ncbi:MAG: endo-1,4-beta-xylanase [Treponema sp.]|nr:endo-1,4-beta-xylanase [Treponema sp.]
MKRNSIFLLIVLLVAPVLYSQQSQNNNVNGFFADKGSFEVLSRYQGRNNVLKVDGSKTQMAIAKYSLSQYKGKPIAIEIMAEVLRERLTDTIHWQVNNTPNYPTVFWLGNAKPGMWHKVRGKIIITPMNSDPFLFLTNWGNNARDTFYITNFNITIEESNIKHALSLPSLKSLYANDFLIGNITLYEDLYTSGNYFELLKHHYNAVTSTETYPSQLAPPAKGGTYQWAKADHSIDVMRRNNIAVHGHILVWHESTPAWLTEGSRSDVEQNMNDYITTVLRHFKGRIASWDVVNEALKDNLSAANVRGDWRNCIKNSQNPWFAKLGADYVELAFRAARAADPSITLYYNDYALENPNKAEAARKMIQDINDRYKRETGGTRNLIEGVGSQAHIYGMNLNINDARSALEKLISLGIEVAISELDVPTINFDYKNVGNNRDTKMSEKDQIAQAVIYARLMNLYREYSSYITRVTMWGMDDRHSWLSTGNPSIFDWKLNAKQAFYAVSDPDGFLVQYGGRTRR